MQNTNVHVKIQFGGKRPCYEFRFHVDNIVFLFSLVQSVAYVQESFEHTISNHKSVNSSNKSETYRQTITVQNI